MHFDFYQLKNINDTYAEKAYSVVSHNNKFNLETPLQYRFLLLSVKKLYVLVSDTTIASYTSKLLKINETLMLSEKVRRTIRIVCFGLQQQSFQETTFRKLIG